jgi:hypothetical protein
LWCTMGFEALTGFSARPESACRLPRPA